MHEGSNRDIKHLLLWCKMASWFQSQLQHYSSAFAAAFALLPVQEFEMSLQVATDGVGLIFSIPVLPLGKANLSLMKLL